MARMLSPWLTAMVLLAAAPAGGEERGAAAATPTSRPGSLAPAPSADDTESAADAEASRLSERLQTERAAELETLDSVRQTAVFQQTRAIDAGAAGGRILAFHPLVDGGLVIATGAGEGYGERSMVGAMASLLGIGDPTPASPANQLVWLDAAGAPTHTVPLPFATKGVTVAPDGAVIAVGGDRVIVFTAAGEQVAEAEAPHVNLSEQELASLREEIADQHREQAAARREQVERIIRGKEALEQVPEDERTPRQKAELARAAMMERSYAAMLARAEATADAAVTAGLAKARTIHRVAASRDHLFLVANEPAGYGFAVWRCGRDFSAPEKIVDSLRGCCGQMDVQVIGDELVIAENARHRVAVYGLDGEPRRTFGRASRTDIRAGFGGCCNPMNACPGPDGGWLLAESNGLVKQFAPDGTLVEILAAADVRAGCKNSSIGLSADGARLYFLDIQQGRVLVMEKKS